MESLIEDGEKVLYNGNMIGDDCMDEYKERLIEKIEELKQEFKSKKEETGEDILNSSPNRVLSMINTYSSGISELFIIAGKINALQEQLKELDYYNKK